VGFDPDSDRAKGWLVTDSGITVVPSPDLRAATVKGAVNGYKISGE
jgi:hypothetical protein